MRPDACAGGVVACVGAGPERACRGCEDPTVETERGPVAPDDPAPDRVPCPPPPGTVDGGADDGVTDGVGEGVGEGAPDGVGDGPVCEVPPPPPDVPPCDHGRNDVLTFVTSATAPSTKIAGITSAPTTFRRPGRAPSAGCSVSIAAPRRVIRSSPD